MGVENQGIFTQYYQDHQQGLQLRQCRSGRQPGAPDVRAGAADRARAVPGRTGAEVHRLHQGAAGAALCRVHRQGDPDRVPGKLL